MVRIIFWEKEPPNRYTQRRNIGYIFYENNSKIGSFRIKGLIKPEISVDLFDQKFEIKSMVRPNNHLLFPKVDHFVFENKSDAPLLKITGNTSISNLQKIIFKKEIVSANREFVMQISRSCNVALFEKNVNSNLIFLKNPRTENGQFSLTEGTEDPVLAAFFYVLHEFMDLNEL